MGESEALRALARSDGKTVGDDLAATSKAGRWPAKGAACAPGTVWDDFRSRCADERVLGSKSTAAPGRTATEMLPAPAGSTIPSGSLSTIPGLVRLWISARLLPKAKRWLRLHPRVISAWRTTRAEVWQGAGLQRRLVSTTFPTRGLSER